MKKAKENISEDILSYDLCIATSRPDEIYQEVYEMLESEGYHNYSCSNLTQYLKAMNTVTVMLKTAMYGFTILLTLIAIANIMNMISTGVLLRRREFAMYRSVGMTSSGFRKMIRLETFLYGIRALVFAIPMSWLISYLMFRSFDEKLYAFDPDWGMYGAAVVVAFAIIGFGMLLSVSRLKDDSIIEALKYSGTC